MQNTLNIARRQFLSYFNGPVAYIVGAVFLIVLGIAVWVWPFPIFILGRATARDLFAAIGVATWLVAPALTMGLIAEEKRLGTIELLMTMPVRDGEVIVGKFLAALGLYTVLLVLSLVHPVLISTLGKLDWGPVVCGYAGAFLYGAAMLAIGMLASGWTDNQLVAFFIALPMCFVFWVVDWLAQIAPSLATFVEFVSFDAHYKSMQRGIIDSRDLIFLLSATLIALGLAFRGLESKRWR